MTTTKTSENEFWEALRRIAQDYPEFAGKFALVEVKTPTSAVPKVKQQFRSFQAVPGRVKTPTSAVPKVKRRCTRWGIDPVTGKRICIGWAPDLKEDQQ